MTTQASQQTSSAGSASSAPAPAAAPGATQSAATGAAAPSSAAAAQAATPGATAATPATTPPSSPAGAQKAAADPSSSKAAPESSAATSEGGSLLEEGFGDGGKAADAQDPSNKTPEGKQDSPTGAPEQYQDFKLPEGTSTDPAMMDEFKSTAKSLNLSQEAAQKLVDFQVRSAQAQQQATLANYKRQTEAWAQETKQTLGPQYQRELGFAAKGIDRYGTPALRKMLNETGLGSHKEFVSYMVKVGKALSEDSFADGKSTSAAPKSLAETLYPNLPSRK